MSPIFTLGHSTLTAEAFVQAARGIDAIIDVRSHPGSKWVPHLSRIEMQKWLPEAGLAYEHWPSLGGWTGRHMMMAPEMAAVGVNVIAYCGKKFPKDRIAAERKDVQLPAWQNQGLYDFSWYMTMPEFLDGMDRLIVTYGGPEQPRAALVCAEAQWWRCHRSMLADYLTWCGVPCYHLPTKLPKRETTSRFQPHADHIGNRLERYDPRIKGVWHKWVYQEQAPAST